MNDDVRQFLEQLISSGLTRQTVEIAVISIILGGLSAFFGSYLARRAQRKADEETFLSRLNEEIQKTFETETVKTAISSAANESLELLRKELNEHIAFVAYRRELITRHHDRLMNSLRDFHACAINAKYEWPDEAIEEERPKMISNLSSIRISSAMLKELGESTADTALHLDEALKNAEDAWEQALIMKVRYSTKYRGKNPDASKPEHAETVDTYAGLESASEKLIDCALKFIAGSVS